MIEAIIEQLAEWRLRRRRKRWLAEHDSARAKADAHLLTDTDLIYAAYALCPCGAGMAYPKGIGAHGFWDCSAVLTGRAVPKGQPGWRTHEARLPFAFWEIKSELQPSVNGATTRVAK